MLQKKIVIDANSAYIIKFMRSDLFKNEFDLLMDSNKYLARLTLDDPTKDKYKDIWREIRYPYLFFRVEALPEQKYSPEVISEKPTPLLLGVILIIDIDTNKTHIEFRAIIEDSFEGISEKIIMKLKEVWEVKLVDYEETIANNKIKKKGLWDDLLLDLWNKNYSAERICHEIKFKKLGEVVEGTVYNRLSLLRKELGLKKVPKGRGKTLT